MRTPFYLTMKKFDVDQVYFFWNRFKVSQTVQTVSNKQNGDNSRLFAYVSSGQVLFCAAFIMNFSYA